MNASYLYCPYCGFEGINVEVKIAGKYGNGRFYTCPSCGEETNDVEIDDEDAEDAQ